MGQEQVKLLDFGIVKLLNPEATRRTHTGSAMGTPQYMSPEQLEEAPLDHRADIYSLGAVTYEMLTGHVPFPGRTQAEVRQLQLTRTPAPPSVVRNQSRLSRALDGAVLWALALDPASRCRRMEDLISAFQAGYERTLVEQALPEAPRRSRRIPVAAWAAGVALAAGIGGAVVYLAKGRTATPVVADAGTSPPARLTEAEAVKIAPGRLREALGDSDTTKRIAAIGAIRTVGRPVCLPELRKALLDNHPDVPGEAARTLSELGDRAAVPGLRAVLRAGGRPKPVLTIVASALGALGDDAGRAWLRRSFQDAKRTKVPQAVAPYLVLLAYLRDSSVAPDLWQTTRPPFLLESRIRSLGALAFLGEEKARAELEAMTRDGSWTQRLQAAAALSRTDGAAVKEILAQALTSAPRLEQLTAAELLAQLKDSRSAKALLVFLHSKDEGERRRSALALGRLGKAGRQELAAALGDPSPEVALAAAAALAGF
jgi:HEAT repeat protein